MNKESLLNKIKFSQRAKDYTYAILFLIVSSFFLLFAIHPALKIAFSLRREAADLKKMDKRYEENINKLIKIQSLLEVIRDDTYLLNQALPNKPQTNLLIERIRELAQRNGITIKMLNVSDIKFKEENNVEEKKGLKQITMRFNTDTDYIQFNNFMKALLNQRRIKLIKKIGITNEDPFSTGSAHLKVTMEIEDYYL